MNNKGFMMAEVIVVSAVILVTLVSLYTSYNKIFSLYNDRITYYDVDTLYELAFIRDNLLDKFSVGNNVQNVSNTDLVNQGFINNNDGKVRKVYYIDKYNINNINKSGINITFKDYIDYLSSSVECKNIIIDGNEYQWNNLFIMEKCDSDGTSNCTYAYLEVPSSKILNELVLYDRGTDKTEITGGYEKGRAVNSSGTSYFEASFTEEDEYLELYSASVKLRVNFGTGPWMSHWGRGSVWTKNKINLNDYNYFEITYTTSQDVVAPDSRYDLIPYMVISTDKNSNPTNGISDNIYVAKKELVQATSSEKVAVIDISSLNTSYYLGFLNTQTLLDETTSMPNASKQTINVHKIRLY